MSNKKSSKSANVLRQTLKTLKSFGFINYDLRRTLNQQQISEVSQLISEHKHLIKSPQSYVKRTVSNQTKDVWSKAGYITSDKYLIIEKHGFDDIHVSKDKIITKSRNKVTTIYPSKGLDLYSKLKQISQRPLRTHEYITVKVGENAPFHSRFTSMEDLLKYVSQWTPKDKGVDEAQLIAQMSVVRFMDYEEMRNFTLGDYDDEIEDEDEDY